MKSIKGASLSSKTVLVRADLDVAMDGETVREDYRLEALLPTLHFLLEQNAAIVIMGHLGRPEGVDPAFSLKPVIARLSELLGQDIAFVEEWSTSKDLVKENIKQGTVVALENLRFDSREKANDDELAIYLASFGDVFINESFATAHREQASTIAITKYLPSYAGLRFEQEVDELSAVRNKPERPLVMVMGGGKAETKVPIVTGVSSFADTILLGGKLMYAKELEGVKGVRFAVDAVRIDDIGPQSVELFKGYLERANTIIWNGPVGRFEQEEYRDGTKAIAEIIAKTSAYKVIGGGDTIAALDMFGLLDKMDFVSTGGGSMLDYLAYGEIPGVEALDRK